MRSSGCRGGTSSRTVPLCGHCRNTSAISPGHLIVGVQVRAEHADEERRALARQRLADALGEHRIDFHQLIRKVIEYRAHPRLDLFGAHSLRAVELNLELTFVRCIRILAVFRAPDLLGHALDAWNRRQPLGNAPAHARRLGERDAGTQRGVRDQVVLTKIGQQPRAEQRQQQHAGGAAQQHRRQHQARARLQPRDRPMLQLLAALQPTGLLARCVAVHQQRAQCRRGAHRHQQRQSDRQQKRGRQRPEECALQTRQHQDRQECDRYGRGGIEHRPSDLERRVEQQRAQSPRRRPRCGAGA